MISAKAFSQLHDVSYETVIFWIRNGLIAGVEKTPLPYGKNKFMYLVPAGAPRPDVKPGPVPKKATGLKRARKASKKAGK